MNKDFFDVMLPTILFNLESELSRIQGQWTIPGDMAKLSESLKGNIVSWKVGAYIETGNCFRVTVQPLTKNEMLLRALGQRLTLALINCQTNERISAISEVDAQNSRLNGYRFDCLSASSYRPEFKLDRNVT